MPKIIFKQSSVYNRILSQIPSYELGDMKKNEKYINRLKKAWNPLEKKVLNAISKTTGFNWYGKEITAYIVTGRGSFSDPLTLSMKKDITRAVDILTHELIHRIIGQPQVRIVTAKKWGAHMRKYKNETRGAAIHIYIHAVHKKVLLDLFNEKRYLAEREWAKNAPDYNRAWEIVDKVGYEKIIKSLQ